MNEGMKVWKLSDTARVEVQTLDRGIVITEDRISNLKYVGSNAFQVGSSRILASASGLNKISSVVGVPGNFVEKCNDQTRTAIFDQFNLADVRYKFVKKDDILVDIFVDSIPYIPFTEIFDAAVSAMSSEKRIQIFSFSNKVIFNFITYENPKVVKAGDDVFKGITVEIDDPGSMRYISMGSFLLRQVCTNGMMSRMTNLKKINGSSKEDIIAGVKNSSVHLLLESVKFVEQFAELANHQVNDPVGYVSRASRVEGHGRLTDDILDPLLTLQNATLYDTVNHLTSFANNMDTLRARRLQSIAGSITQNHEYHCPKCASRIS